MDNSFLNDIAKAALAAAETQDSYTSESSNQPVLSGITEKDGYVGEMVKASLQIFESVKPADYSKKFSSEYTVILSSLSVKVADTDMDITVEAIQLESIRDLLTYIENQLDLDLSDAEGYFGSDNKIHMQKQSEYGLVNIEASVDAYVEVPANKVLNLPLK